MTDVVNRLHDSIERLTAERDEARAEIERLRELSETRMQAVRELRAENERLTASLQTVRKENDRAKREFTNVSNRILSDACSVLDKHGICEMENACEQDEGA